MLLSVALKVQLEVEFCLCCHHTKRSLELLITSPN